MNLSGKLPDEDANGLHRIGLDLVDDPARVRLAVVEFDVSKVTIDTATGGRTATLRLLTIEPVVDRDEVLRIRSLVGRERRRRQGAAPLPGQLALFTEDPEDGGASAMDRIDPGP